MAASFLTADTSIIVPACLRWHELHDAAFEAMERVECAPAHALLEAFSVLTRLPGSRALRPGPARRVLMGFFPEPPLTLSPAGHEEVMERLARAEIGGGRVYDALVGAIVAEAGGRLLTADRRAVATYAVVGVEFKLVE